MGYAAGAKAQKPDINVLQVYIPQLHRPRRGGEAARSQIAEGADVIFGAGGQTGSGGIQAAARPACMVIGVDQDEYVTTFRRRLGGGRGQDRLERDQARRQRGVRRDQVGGRRQLLERAVYR